MTNIEIAVKATKLYEELFKIQKSGNRLVNTNKRNTTVETELVVFSEVDAEIFELEPNKPYIEVTIGLSSVRGKVAKRSAYFATLEEANQFISEFSKVVK